MLKLTPCAVSYIDPPYNQHKYAGNYHIWESLVLWDKPEVYGVACKRVDCRESKSPFNSKKTSMEALSSCVSGVSSEHTIVSFSDEGFRKPEDIVDILKAKHNNVYIAVIEFNRYVGSKIGIYGRDGKIKGEVSHTKNNEILFIGTNDEPTRSLAEAGAAKL